MQDSKQCNLVGTLGIVIQITLMLVCCVALLYKRHIEKPKRSFLVFFLDLSKQGFAQVSVHFVNIVISTKTKHECSSYLFISTFDTFVGLGVNYVLLKAVSWLAEMYGISYLLSGNYFADPNPLGKEIIDSQADSRILKKMRVDYKVWGMQAFMWCSIVLTSKLIMYAVEIRLELCIYLIHLLLSVMPGVVKIVFVLVVAPAILNCVMVWIQDSLLKKNKFTEEEKDNLYNFFYEGEDLFDNDTASFKASGGRHDESRTTNRGSQSFETN